MKPEHENWGYLDFVRDDERRRKSKWWPILIFATGVCAIVVFPCWWFLGFGVETMDEKGRFTAYPMNLFDRLDIVEAVKFGRVRSVIWCGDGFYTFTSAGKVLTMGVGEGGSAPCIGASSDYEGDPHDYPFKRIVYSVP